jgi:hypothetical protein
MKRNESRETNEEKENMSAVYYSRKSRFNLRF